MRRWNALYLVLLVITRVWAQCEDAITDCADLGCDTNEFVATCRGVNLTCVPTCLARTAVYATFVYNLIRSLNADSFKHLLFLRTLDVSHNPLEHIEPDTFRYIANLGAINIDDNNLLILPADLFTFMPNVYSISLNNHVTRTSVDVSIFSNKHGLKYLNIGGNDLIGLSESTFSELTDLAYLYIPRNGLSLIPGGLFSNNLKLRVLDIGGNSFTALSSDIFRNHGELIELYINGNQITDFQNDLFTGTPNISTLDLSENRLSGLNPLTFQPMPKLTTLLLYGNQITEIESNETFHNNENIWIFNIRNNSLSSLDPSVFSAFHHMLVFLEGNPWNCDCSTVGLMNAFSQQEILIFEDPGCTSPPEFEGIPWLNVTLTCP